MADNHPPPPPPHGNGDGDGQALQMNDYNPPSPNHVNDNEPAPQLTPPADVQHPNVIIKLPQNP
jgi:hypothetical protein